MRQTPLAAAQKYMNLGLSVIPVHPASHPEQALRKHSIGKWKPYQSRIATSQEIQVKFNKGADIAIVAGAVSGNLEVLDFDEPSLFQPYRDTIESLNQDLANKLIHSTTPSGGFHILYRCKKAVGGNQKLAMSKDGQQVLIETRGQGGYFLVEPSQGYSLSAPLDDIYVLNEQERKLLLNLARDFDERPIKESPSKEYNKRNFEGVRPSAVLDRMESWEQLLSKDAWTFSHKSGTRDYWCRPDKSHGCSASLHPEKGLYCFSTSTVLQNEKPYSKFGYIIDFRFNGNATEAAKWVRGSWPNEFPQQVEQQTAPDKSDKKKKPVNPATLLEGFAVTDEYVNNLGEEKFLYDNYIINQHVVTVIAMSGCGKTTFNFFHVAPKLAEEGQTVWYIDADSPASDHRKMKAVADKYGFKFLNPDVNEGTSIESLLKVLQKIADTHSDMTDNVLFFDTLKKAADLMSKGAVKDFFKLTRKLANLGATIVLLGHANKYRDKEGNLIFEGVGDIRSDSDELIIFESEKSHSGGINVTTVIEPDRGAKVRGLFKPFSFNISTSRKISFHDNPLSLIDHTATSVTKSTDNEILNVAEKYLTERAEPVLQKQLIEHVADITDSGIKRVRQRIVRNAEIKGTKKLEGKRFVYSVGKKNSHMYELPPRDPVSVPLFGKSSLAE